jgi:hypothetical protein
MHNLSVSRMKYWRLALAKRPSLAAKAASRGDLPVIIPVPMPRRPSEALPALRVVVGERRIEVTGDFDPGVLAKLVRTLEDVA